jgi:hypothetical protein
VQTTDTIESEWGLDIPINDVGMPNLGLRASPPISESALWIEIEAMYKVTENDEYEIEEDNT